MLNWYKQQYLVFTGTDNYSWTKNHAYSFIWAKELTVNGKKMKWVKIRNPWGSHDWSGTKRDTYAKNKSVYGAD